MALEALASGTPLVASYAGGIPTIVGAAGLLVKPNDPCALASCLKGIIENDSNYDTLVQLSIQRARSELDMSKYVQYLIKQLE